jgi:hypothetical protein
MHPRYPKDSLCIADLIPVNSRAGLPKLSIQSDVDKLMAHFLSVSGN